jgi:hypothetical protein
MEGIAGELEGICSFAKMATFTGSKLDCIDDEDLSTCPVCKLFHSGIDYIFTTLYWTIKGKGGL